MSDNLAEAKLLRQAKNGDESAFVLLYERHRTPVFHFAYRLLGSTELAEDVTHDCFMALLRRPEGYDPELASLRTYLCAAARNMAFKQLRRRGVETSVEDPPEVPPDPPPRDALGSLIEAEVADEVQRAVAALPPLQRETVVLFEYMDLSLAEVAAAVGADVGTVKSRLHRARQRLRRWLEPFMDAGRPASAPVENQS